MTRLDLAKMVLRAFAGTGAAPPKAKLLRMIYLYQGHRPDVRPARSRWETSGNARQVTVRYGFTVGTVACFCATFAVGWDQGGVA